MLFIFSAVTPADLRHLTKHRAEPPVRRPPSNYHQGNRYNLDLSNQGQSEGQGQSPLHRSDGTPQNPSVNMTPEFVDGRNGDSVSRFIVKDGKDIDDSDSDDTKDDLHQVDALVDLPSSKLMFQRTHEHYRKRRMGNQSSVLTKRLHTTDKLLKPPTPMAFSTTGHSEELTPKEPLPPIAADSIQLAKTKHALFGSSPKLKTKLTKPAKLPVQEIKYKKHQQGGLELRRDLQAEVMTPESMSRSLDIPESSKKKKKLLMTDGKASSFDSSFRLIEINTDSDEEIMV